MRRELCPHPDANPERLRTSRRSCSHSWVDVSRFGADAMLLRQVPIEICGISKSNETALRSLTAAVPQTHVGYAAKLRAGGAAEPSSITGRRVRALLC